jgi:hypothetical protein
MIERLDNFFTDIFKDLFCESEKDKLIIMQLNKIGLCLNFQNEILGKLFSINKNIYDKLGENNMKLNDIKAEVADLGTLFTKVAAEIETEVAGLEATIATLVEANTNPEVEQALVDGLANLRAIGAALDAKNPDVVVEAPVAEVPVPVVEAPVAEVPVADEPKVDPAVEQV